MTQVIDPTSYVPSPTCVEYISAVKLGPVDEIRLLILRGDRGAGKTTCGLWACAQLAARCAEDKVMLPLDVAVVRDTWTNIERTTLPSFREWAQKGLSIEITNGGKEAILGRDGTEFVHFWFFGLDRAEDADKLQGFKCGILWLEEVAPAAGVSGGIPASVLGLGVTSVRQAGVPPRVMVTMNPPDKNHWILKVEQVLVEMGIENMKIRHFVMDPNEKSAHFYAMAAMETDFERSEIWRKAAVAHERYRERNRAILEAVGRHDLVQRLVEGEIGEVRLGEAVVPNFSRLLHVAKKPLKIVRAAEIIRGLDSGINDLHPAVVWAQCGPDWLNVLGSRVGTNIGIDEFLKREVLPFEKQYGLVKARGITNFGAGGRAGFRFRNIGDPAMFATDGRSARTAALVFEEIMKEGVEKGPVEWAARRESLYAAFGRKGLGDRMFIQIDPDENEILIDGLAGRFHYPENKASGEIEPVGDISGAKRVSGRYSHPVDGLGYILAVLFPAADWHREQMKEKAPGVPVTNWLAR